MAFRFLDFEVDPTLFRLTRAGEPVAIERRVFDLVLYLIQHRDRVVPREELIREVWQGTAVTDHVLAQALHTARKLLRDSASEPAILRTVRGRGVQFVAPTEIAIHPAGPEVVPFIGREAELSRMFFRLSSAADHRSFVSIVSGEAGIGKSAFCGEVASYAEHQGWSVLLGKCSQVEGAPALMPWRRMYEGLRRQSGDKFADTELPLDVLQFLTFGGSAAARDVTWSDGEVGYSHQEVLERVWSFWVDRSREDPLLLVIEDIHWADHSSLQLLRVACESSGGGRLALLLTFRGSHMAARTNGREELGFLGTAASEFIDLRPISYDESREIARELGTRLAESELRSVHDQSGGNPLFWHRLHRLRVDGHKHGEPMPLTVRAAVLENVRMLSLRCREALEVAAVLGCEFSLYEIGRVLSRANDRLMGEFELATQAEIVRPTGFTGGGMEFVHAVVRDAIYEDLNDHKRREIHSTIAQLWPTDTALEGRTRRAHHYLAGAPIVPTGIAVREAVECAWDAVQSLSFDDALPILKKVEGVIGPLTLDPETRCKFLLGLAECQLRHGDRQKGALNLRDAAALAEAAGMPEVLSQVALRATPGLLAIDTLRRDALTEDLLRRAHECCRAPGTRALLAARLAMVLYWKAGTSKERHSLVHEALNLSQEDPDLVRRGQILAYKIGSLWKTDGLQERRSDAESIVSLGSVSGNGELEALGHIFLITCLQESGSAAGAEAQVEALAELVNSGARVGPQASWYLPMYRASAALNRGELLESSRLLQEAAKLGEKTGAQNFEFSNAGLLAGIAYFSGAFDQAAGAVEEMVLRFPDFWPWRTGRLFLLSAVGDAREIAAEELPELADELLVCRDQEMFRLASLVQLANVAADCGDRHTGSRLLEELVPYTGRLSVAGYGVMTFGTVARPIGNLMCLAGEVEQGVALIEQASRLCRRSGLASWDSICKADLACALRQRAATGDLERAELLEGEIREFGVRTGMVAALVRLSRTRSGLN